MKAFPESVATQLIDKHVRQHLQLKLSDQSDVVILQQQENLSHISIRASLGICFS